MALELHISKLTHHTVGFDGGVTREYTLAQDATPQNSDQHRDGYQTFPGYLGNRHRPTMLQFVHQTHFPL